MSKDIEVTSLANIPRKYNFPLQVKNIGRVRVAGDKYCGNHHNNIEFCFRLKSSEKESLDQVEGQILRTGFPHVFIKQPGYLHKYSYNAIRESFFIIYPAESRTELLKLGFPLHRFAVEFRCTEKIRSIMGQLTELLRQSEVSGVVDEIDSLALLLLVTVFNAEKSDRTDRSLTAEAAKIQNISSFLRMHFNEKIDMTAAARKFGLSRRNFYRLWKKYYVRTPAGYVLDLKLQEAARLLEDHSFSIKEIAARLYFPDSSYFIAAFRKHRGMTPLQYRRKLTSEG